MKENKNLYCWRVFWVITQETKKSYGSPDTQENEYHGNEGQFAFCSFYYFESLRCEKISTRNES